MTTVRGLLLGGLLLLAAACRYPLDRLYALPLERAPTREDWAEAVPLALAAVGGRTSAPSAGALDADAVHVSTASCHHGSGAPPVAVELRAFWTAERLYVQMRWDDPTASRGELWRWDGSRWRAGSPGADGAGILWGVEDGAACAKVCHLQDWRMAGDRALADYAMGTGAADPPLDFWVWRAGYGAVDGVVEDSALTPSGRRGDGGAPEVSFRPNSVSAAGGGMRPFGEGDRPLEAPPPVPGAQVPGHLANAFPAGRSEVSAMVERTSGGWSLTLSRRLVAGEPEDLEFVSGGEYRFGLAILDAVDIDHLVVPETLLLYLVPAAGAAKR